MITKDAVYSLGKKGKNAFTHIKQAITYAPTLYKQIFNKYFLLCTFTSDKFLVVVLN